MTIKERIYNGLKGLIPDDFYTINFVHNDGTPFSPTDVTPQRAILHGYMNSGKWYPIASLCARGVASLPYRLYRKGKNGQWEIVDEGPIYDAIFKHKYGTLREHLEMIFIHYFTNGEGFSYMQEASIGFPETARYFALPPEITQVVVDNTNSIFSTVTAYKVQDGTGTRTIPAEDVLHLSMPNPSASGMKKKRGLSPLQPGNNLLNAANNIDTGRSEYFENRGVSNMISGSERPENAMTTTDKKDLDKALKGRIGGAKKVNSSIVTKGAVKVHQLNASSSDMEMLGNGVQALRDLCALLHFPSILVGDNEQSTYNNMIEGKKTAYEEVYIPHGMKAAEGWTRQYLAPYNEGNEQYKIGIDIDSIDALRMSPKELRELLIKEVDSGVKSRNEARVEAGGEARKDIPEMDIPSVRTQPVYLGTENNPSNEEG